jgi:hypothetical protein
VKAIELLHSIFSCQQRVRLTDYKKQEEMPGAKMDPSSDDGGRVKDLDLSTEVSALIALYFLTRVACFKFLFRNYIKLPNELIFLSSAMARV